MEEKKKDLIPEIGDEALDKISGGLQATVANGDKGPGEFGENKPKKPEETEQQRQRRLMMQIEGSGYL